MNLNVAYGKVLLVNNIVGNLDNVNENSVDLSLSLMYEELVETITAFEAKDAQEVLDGAADSFVTLCNLLQVLDKAGFKVMEAIDRVCDNNLTKFPSASESIVVAGDLTLTKNEAYNVWILKNSNGKYQKPPKYVRVNLDGLYPTDFFKGGSIE